MTGPLWNMQNNDEAYWPATQAVMKQAMLQLMKTLGSCLRASRAVVLLTVPHTLAIMDRVPMEENPQMA